MQNSGIGCRFWFDLCRNCIDFVSNSGVDNVIWVDFVSKSDVGGIIWVDFVSKLNQFLCRILVLVVDLGSICVDIVSILCRILVLKI